MFGNSFGNSNNNNAFGSGQSSFGNNVNTMNSQPANNNLFGMNNNSNQTNAQSGFGGFSNNNSTQSTFGQSNAANTSFGGLNNQSNNNNGNPFGSMNNQTNNAFGMNNTNTNNSGGLFGQNNNQQQQQGGLFGQNNNNTNTNTGGGLFGQAKPSMFGTNAATNNAFGGTSNTFGANNNANNAFGSNTTNNAFGSNTTNNAFGANTNNNNAFGGMNNNQQQGGLFGQQQGNSMFRQNNNNQQQQGGLFGNKPATSAGLFGQNSNTQQQGNLFGNKPAVGGGLFGQNNSAGTNAFGANNTNNTNNALGANTGTNNTFGANNTTNNAFGMNNNTGNTFGMNNNTTNNAFGGMNNNQQQGGLFGNKPATSAGLFGQNNNTQQPQQGGLFGQTNNNNTMGGGLFGQSNNQQPPQQGGLFGQNNSTNAQTGGLFGNKPANTLGAPSSFGTNNAQGGFNNATNSIFGANNNTATNSGGLFGNKPTLGASNSTVGGGLFGQNNNAPNSMGSGLFGQNNNTQQPQQGGLFGQNNNTNTQAGGLFGSKPALGSTGATGGLFGQNNTANNTLGGAPAPGASATGGLFGAKPAGTLGTTGGITGATTGGLFGAKPAMSTLGSTGFGAPAAPTLGAPAAGGLFGAQPTAQKSLFGATTNNPSAPVVSTAPTSGLFGAKLGTTAPQTTQTSLFGQNQSGNSTLTSGALGQTAIMTNPGSQNDDISQLFVKIDVGESITQPNEPLTNNDVSGISTIRPSSRGVPKSFFLSRKPISVNHGTNTKTNLLPSSEKNSSILLLPNSTSDLLFNPNNSSFKTLIIKKHKEEKSKDVKDNEDIKRISFTNETTKDVEGTDSFINLPQTPVPQKTVDIEQVDKVESIKVFPPITPVSSEEDIVNTAPVSKDSFVKFPNALNDDILFLDNGYYISPSLDSLNSMDLLSLRNVSNLIVGHKDFGKIEFLEPVDLNSVSLKHICGGIIKFLPQGFVAYEGFFKPPKKGEGLNSKAKITLFNCYPRKKDDRSPITDVNHPILEKHIKNLKESETFHFVSYEPSSGKYIFTIDQLIN